MKKSHSSYKYLNDYAFCSVDELYTKIPTSHNGLSIDQVDLMKDKYGKNKIIHTKYDTNWHRFRRAFINPFSVILLVLAIVSLITDVLLVSNFTRNITTFFIICFMIIISGVIRLIQELSAKNSLEQIQTFVNTKITVKRQSVLINISMEELTVGDIVYLSPGNRVPADMRIINSKNLYVSQAAITGESNIVPKNNITYDKLPNKNITQYENLVFMGTTVISGNGEGVVISVGKNTLYSSFKNPYIKKVSTFQTGANSIAWVMIRFMAILVPIVLIASGITKDHWLESFIFALSVAVGLIPEMLPMVITACLAKGSVSMSKKQTIVKNINAMQGFGCMDILCIDKTGTLTNENIILEYYMDILGNDNENVLDLAFINSSYHSGIKNPIDDAILQYKLMPNKQDHFTSLLKKYTKVDEMPFDYDRKFVSTLVSSPTYGNQLITKGDISTVLSLCKYVEFQGETLPIQQDMNQDVGNVVDEMLEDGMKVIAVAKKNVGKKYTVTSEDENDMILMGYLAFFDAPKQSAKQSISALKALHVKSKVLTGDQSKIALSVCKRVGIETQSILTGSQLNQLSDLQLQKQVENVDIFAELTPAQKVRIIDALHENGHTVGFLGDGINDILSISQADVGISVDNAVDTAKNVADVVLLHKDLNVLEQGILEGRKIFVNMLKYIKITASSNFGNILSIVCASAFLPFLPMTAIQLLLLNLLYDTLCIVLPWDNVDMGDIFSPKEWSGKTLGKFMLSFGPISSVFDIITYLFLYFILCPSMCGGMLYTQLNDPALKLQYISLFQTGWFLESMWTQILILHMLRTQKIPIVQSKASTPVLLITLAGILVFTAFSFTSFSELIGLSDLPPWYFIFLFVIVIFYMLFTTFAKKRYINKYHELI